jgi:hypothetical protein
MFIHLLAIVFVHASILLTGVNRLQQELVGRQGGVSAFLAASLSAYLARTALLDALVLLGFGVLIIKSLLPSSIPAFTSDTLWICGAGGVWLLHTGTRWLQLHRVVLPACCQYGQQLLQQLLEEDTVIDPRTGNLVRVWEGKERLSCEPPGKLVTVVDQAQFWLRLQMVLAGAMIVPWLGWAAVASLTQFRDLLLALSDSMALYILLVDLSHDTPCIFAGPRQFRRANIHAVLYYIRIFEYCFDYIAVAGLAGSPLVTLISLAINRSTEMAHLWPLGIVVAYRIGAEIHHRLAAPSTRRLPLTLHRNTYPVREGPLFWSPIFGIHVVMALLYLNNMWRTWPVG